MALLSFYWCSKIEQRLVKTKINQNEILPVNFFNNIMKKEPKNNYQNLNEGVEKKQLHYRDHAL